MTTSPRVPFRYGVAKTYPARGPLQQYRLASSTSFPCSRCGTAKTSKLLATVQGAWDRLLCNGCYGRLLSIWEIKAGTLADEARDSALLETLTSIAPAEDVALAQVRLLASGDQHAHLSDEAQRMLATAYAVTTALRGATGLDWSVAMIGLCKAVESESVRRIAEPLSAASEGRDMTLDLQDPDFARVARYCTGKGKAPELGTLAHFLRTAANSRQRAETSSLVAALRTASKAWPSGDWLFAREGFPDAVDSLTRDYRNPAAHTSLFSEDDFSQCADAVRGEDGLLWRLLVATSGRKSATESSHLHL